MRWVILSALSFNAGAMAFCFMSFLTTADIAIDALNVDPSSFQWLYPSG